MSSDYHRIGKAIDFLTSHASSQPSLEETAASIGLSEYHFQRLFQRWVGISPKKFLQFLTLDFAKERLDQSASILDASYASGLSGPGRLHDLFLTLEGVTPGEYKERGLGVSLNYGFHESPFGTCFIAAGERGLSALAFIDSKEERAEVVAWIRQYWNRAELHENGLETRPWRDLIFLPGEKRERSGSGSGSLKLYVRGTPFQLKVWEALLRIPDGCLSTYSRIARQIERPAAVRAVASAVGANPISFLIPCHRVLRKSGALGGYRWGLIRKRALLGWEASKF